MHLNRSELRGKIMVILYQIFLYKENNTKYEIKDVINETMEINNNFVDEVVNGTLEYINDIDKIANKYLTNWTIDRLGLTDKAILRMAIYEMLYTETPEIVCINEAIELSKAYSDDKVAQMINGVLDKIYKTDNKNKE